MSICKGNSTGVLVAIIVLQETAVAVEDVVGVVAGQALEGRIHVDQDSVVIAFLFSHHDPVVGGVNHALQQCGIDHLVRSARAVDRACWLILVD
ncbi:hypothetical protein D9M73_266680 [compost metagenome]